MCPQVGVLFQLARNLETKDLRDYLYTYLTFRKIFNNSFTDIESHAH